MTPKEKAKDLVKRFENENLMFEKEIIQDAKKSALITVNEIIQDYMSYRVKHYLTLEHAKELVKYWEKIRIEIENFEPE